jgi:probable HAF family extracellular repeat protein
MLGRGTQLPFQSWELEPLTYPGATETAAQGINNSGQVVGSFPDVGGTHGFVYLENVGVFSPPLNCPTGIMTTI